MTKSYLLKNAKRSDADAPCNRRTAKLIFNFQLLIFNFLALPTLAQCQQPTNMPAVASPTITEKSVKPWKAAVEISESDVAQQGIDAFFSIDTISDAVFSRMKGKSYGANCTVPRSDLRYLRMLHVDAEGCIKTGEMVCNKIIANDLLDIFKQLYQAKYPIERMVLIDDYNANDELSMRDNNSSCFNFRVVAGSKTLSKHARGLAVDINTRYNPYVRTRQGRRLVSPDNGTAYADRSRPSPYKIERGDLLYRLFIEHGFTWGGAWKYSKDYQHFEKR